MSMGNYAVDDYGLLLTEGTMKVIASKVCDDFEDMEEDEYGYSLYEKGICEYVSEFEGEAGILLDNGLNNWVTGGEIYNEDSIYYIPCKSYPTLFKAAYENMDALIAEFKEKVGEYLPKDFDYRSNIRHIVGTYWG